MSDNESVRADQRVAVQARLEEVEQLERRRDELQDELVALEQGEVAA
jgi:hypothetical protein